MPIVEIVTFLASDAFLADPEVYRPALKILASAEGYIQSYHGIQMQDKKTGYLIVVWETLEHHKKLIAGESYKAMGESMKQAVAGDLKMVHVELNADPLKVLGSGFVEILQIQTKEGAITHENISDFGNEVKRLLTGSKGYSGPASWGKTLENPEAYVMLQGWESLQAHDETVTAELLGPFAAKFPELASISAAHVSLKANEKE